MPQSIVNLILVILFTSSVHSDDPFTPCQWNELVKVIDCTQTSLRAVPRFDPAGRIVNSFTLMSNAISIISGDALKPLSKTLQSFQLIENEPSAGSFIIDDIAFTDLPSLRALTISNKMAPTNRLAFSLFVQSTDNLEELSIETVLLKDLTSFNAPKLRKIKLRKTSLRSSDINENAFTGVPNLEELILNQICENAGSGCLSNIAKFIAPLSKLKLLDISQNDIGSLGSIIFPASLATLQSLSMINCKIDDSQFFMDLTNLKSLSTFQFKSNPITTIDENNFMNIGNLPLKVLDLSETDVTKIPSFVSKFSSTLEDLILHGTKIIDLTSNSIGNLENLRTLSVDPSKSNQVFFIQTGAFRNLKNLNKLYLGNIDRISFDDQNSWNTLLSYLNQLTELRLVNMNLNDDFFKGIPTLSKLIKLNLDNNKLSLDKNEQNIFQKFPKLQELTLTSNSIIKLSDEAFNGLNFNSLKKLDLSQNAITVIEPCAFGLNPSDNVLVSMENIECDCKIVWMKSYQHLWQPLKVKCPNGDQLVDSCPAILTCQERFNEITPVPTWGTDLPANFDIKFTDFSDRIVMLHLNALTEDKMKSLFTKVQVTLMCEADNTEISIGLASPTTKIELAHPTEYYTYCIYMHFRDGRLQKKCYTYKISAAKLTVGYIAAIIIAPLMLAALIILVIFLVRRNRHRREMKNYRQSNGSNNKNRESMPPLGSGGYFEHEGQRMTNMNQPGSRMGMSMYASNHSLARSTHSIGEMFDPIEAYPPTERRYKRTPKMMSKSMDMLDTAPNQRPQTKMYRRSQWQSSTDVLRDRRQSTVSNRLPLSLSLAYLESGYQPPQSSHPPLPEPPRDSTYEEIPDVLSPARNPGSNSYCEMNEDEPYMQPEMSCGSNGNSAVAPQYNPYYAHSLPGGVTGYNNSHNSYIAPRVDQSSENDSLMQGYSSKTGSLY